MEISPGLVGPMEHLAETNAKLLRRVALRTQARWEIISAYAELKIIPLFT